ncbi:MFS transporter [Anaerolineales bacterium HSG6]|nr:MFS transporter [Anaerolineales bacterium HSG6]
MAKKRQVSNAYSTPSDEGVIRAAPPNSGSDVGIWVLAATIIGSSMAFIDGTVVNVALPVLQEDLNASVSQVQWIVESYALFLAALILVGGSLGDHFGRRRIFTIGIIVFTIASVWAGFSPTAEQLIYARAVQGIGGALLVPSSLAVISASFSESERGRAIGTWSGFTAITTALGPVLGGWLVENVSWRWVFFINVPLAIITLLILFWKVPESKDEEGARKLDWPGAVAVTIGLGCLVFGLIESSNYGLFHPLVIGTIIVGVIGLVAFMVIETRSSAPMMPLNLFQSRTFSGANLLTLFLYSALSGTLFFLPFNLIQVQGYTATQAGAAFLPFILIMFALSRWAGSLIDRYGARLPLIIGPIIAGVGFAMFAIPGIGGTYWTTFFPAIVVLGFGMTVSVSPLTTAVMSSVEVRHSGIASGINNAVSRTAGLIAIAILGIVALALFNNALDSHLTPLNLTPEVEQAIDQERIKLAGAQIPEIVPTDLQPTIEQAIAESFVFSFRIIMLIGAGLAVLSAGMAFVLIETHE